MRYHYFLLISIFLTMHSCDTVTMKENVKQKNDSTEIVLNNHTKQLRHVVLFNFNDTATKEIINKIEQTFLELQNKISEIHSFEWGTNNSPEGLDKGLTHCFLVTFLKEEDRAKYLPHPAHQEFVKFIGPYVEDVTVFDYWAN